MPRKSRMDRDSSLIGDGSRPGSAASRGPRPWDRITPSILPRPPGAGRSLRQHPRLDRRRDRRESDLEPRPRGRLAPHRDRAAAGRRDPADDRQAQPRPGHAPPARPGRAVERLEDVRAHLPARSPGRDPRRPARPPRGPVASRRRPASPCLRACRRCPAGCRATGPGARDGPGSTRNPARRHGGRSRRRRRPARCSAAQRCNSIGSRPGNPASASARLRNRSASTICASCPARPSAEFSARRYSSPERSCRRATWSWPMRMVSGVRNWWEASPLNRLCRS